VAKKAAKALPTTGVPEIDKSIDQAVEKMAAEGTRCMVTLSARALHLLDTAVLVDGHDRSEVVEGLILEHLGGYYSGRSDRMPAAAGAQ
jgi:hypothetical protein